MFVLCAAPGSCCTLELLEKEHTMKVPFQSLRQHQISRRFISQSFRAARGFVTFAVISSSAAVLTALVFLLCAYGASSFATK